MEFERIEKPAFSVIGKLGSTDEGSGFITKLWDKANAGFNEIKHLVLFDESGKPMGIYGAMSDMGMNFEPWENNFSKGYYLAGAQCRNDAIAPDDWTKWTIPGFVFLKVKVTGPDTFKNMISYMNENSITLAGAVHDFTDPKTGQGFMLFPIKRI